MNPVLKNILLTGKVATAGGQEMLLHSQLPEREGLLLQHWLEQYRPSRLLEVGLGYGISSMYISDLVSEWPVEYYHIIDAFQARDWQGIGVKNLQDAGYWSSVVLHEELSELCLPRLLAEDLRYDFAFVDGWHTFDHVMLEFFYINRMLEVGGVIVFDDIHLPSLQKVLKCIDTYDCYERLALPEQFFNSVPIKVRRMMGLPAVRIEGFLKIGEDLRDWDWFSDF